MATRKLTEVDITNTVMDSDTLLTVRGNLVQRVKKSDLTRGFISQEDLAVERARIDNLLKLEEGSTTGDAELQDLRVGIDGTEYESAGTAVRTQIENLAAIVEEGGLNLDELVLSVNKDANKATIYMSDGKVEKTADIPMAVDSVLLIDSPNPVQNMVIATEINTLYEELEVLKNEGIGGETGTTIRLTNQNGTATLISSYGKAAILMFTFSSTQDDLPSGNGNCKISVNGIQKLNVSIPQGLNSIDVSPYLTIGSNSVVVTCTDVFGKSRSLAYDITVVQLTIESTFDASVPYTGDITFKYTPYGAIDKTIHFVIDGNEVGTVKTSLTGKQMTRVIPFMSHGTHKLEVYSTASMEESTLESSKLTYDIMCLEESNTTSMIASAYTVEAVSQGELISIPYIVYDPTKLACDITLTVYTMESGERVVYGTPQEITVDRSQKYWNTRKYPIGNVYFEIKYGDVIPPKTHCVVVAENKIKIEAETNDLELLLLSEGRSNDELNPATWSYGDVTTTFSNMNWGSVGWINDENGDTCLRLNGDARAEIQFQPFAEDLRTYGKTLELEFVVRDVNNRDATVISCMSGDIGFEVKADTAYIVSEQSRVFCNYKHEERVRLAFVVESKNEYRLLSIYLNGVLSDIIQYPATDNFQQKVPVNISVGSSDCGVDLYVVRSYTTALPSHSIMTNYTADMTNVALKTEIYEANDIYDDYGKISFEKAKAKNSVMVIVGALPQSKGDKKIGKVVYYDVEDANLNFEDTMTIDVQGTSSQFYVRKNWKLKFENEHLIDVDQLPARVICIKVDYAEATGTHNTQNAVLVERLYTEQVPPQAANPKVRTTIYGKPILLFHQAKEGETPTFYGKANFNYDKGAEEVFGFTSDYDVECWEFCNNTSDACNFLGEIPESWGDDFEARYPDKYKDITRFKEMHDWVVSTNQDAATGNNIDDYVTSDGTTYTVDTAEYRLAKFKEEFGYYFNLHYSLIYYVYTFVALMVDQRAKNMFLTRWGGKGQGKWYPYFYDNDTCFGINNEGQLVFDYYHEDTDQVDGANVYNGQNSTLWTNFREAYADEIKETYQKLRGDGLITYDILEEQFITKGSDKWSESVFNEDGEFKYVSMVKTDGDASKLSFLRGDGEQHFRYFVENRLNYCDSKWYATDYANDFVSLRIYTPTDANGNPRTDLAVAANADITVVPYSNMYAGVRYKANGTLYQERVEHGEEITFEAPDETFNDTETAIYGASQLSSLGDLAPLYCGTVDVSKATKLTEIKIGDGTTGYANNNLKELSVGTNKLLKKIDIQNCPSFTSALGLAGCQNIEEIYAKGSGITGVELADSGYLKIVQLPATIANLTIKNQEYIEEFSMEGYSALKTMQVENCPAIDTLNILDSATNLERVRLTGVEWEYDDTSFLYELKNRNLAGIDENGSNTDIMWLDGTCHIKSLTGAEFNELRTMFPYLTITYDNLDSQLIYIAPVDLSCSTNNDGVLVFNSQPTVDEDGVLIVHPNAKPALEEDGTLALPNGDVWVEVHRETVKNAGNGTCPVTNGTIETPELEPTAQYIYTFNGWSKEQDNTVDSDALLNVEGDRYVYASFEQETRYYTVNFYIDGTLKETYQVPYGGTATFSGSTEHPTNPDIFEFVEWKPSPANITGDTNCYAQYYDTREITDDWATIAANVNNGTATTKYAIGSYKTAYIGAVELPYAMSKGAAVVYNDEIHILGSTKDDTVNTKKHYKYNGVEWVEASTLPFNLTSKSTIVYNNEIHIFQEKNHYKWDGSEWTQVSTLPYSGICSVVIFNNELHIMGGYSHQTRHYKWDGAEWLEASTLPFNFHSSCAVTFNNEIHIIGSNSSPYRLHYKWNGTEWLEDVACPFNFYYGSATVYNNEIHIMGGANAKFHYKYTGTDWVSESILPFNSQDSNTIVYNDVLYIIGSSLKPSAAYFYRYNGTNWLPINYDEVIDMEVIAHNHDELSDGIKKWESVSKPTFLVRYANVVVYNNELHGIDTAGNHYKWNGTEWVKVSTIPYNTSSSRAIVYNNEIHIIGGNGNKTAHYKYDGSSWTEVSTLPNEFNGDVIVYNNEIHLLQNGYPHCKWNGTTWTEVGKMPFGHRNNSCSVVYNGEIHIIASYDNRHCKFDGTAWTNVGTVPNNGTFGGSSAVVYNNEIHAFYTNRHFVWDGVSWSELDNSAVSLSYGEVLVFNNEIHMLDSYNHFKWSTASFEIVETVPFIAGSYSRLVRLNNKLYYVCSQYNDLYSWDGESWTNETTMPVPSNKVVAVHNGAIYLYNNTNVSTSDYYQKLYKYDGSTWTEVCSGFPINGYGASLCSYNGYLHLIGGYYTGSDCDYYWDGTQWVKAEVSPPKNFGPCQATVYNGEIHLFNGTHYKFNGTEWSIASVPPTIKCNVEGGTIITSDEKYLYILGNNEPYTLFKWDGVEWTQIPINSNMQYSRMCSFREKIHLFDNTGSRNHYVLENPKATLTFFAKNLLKDNRAIGSNKYSTSTFRTWLNNDLFNALPNDLQSAVKEVIKLNNLGSSYSDVSTVFKFNDKCFILSEHEAGRDTSTTYLTCQGQGEVYPVFTDNASRKRAKNDGTYNSWWLRSVSTGNRGNYKTVDADGSLSAGGAGNTATNISVCFGFCI